MSSGKITREICEYYKNGGCTSKDNKVCGFVCGNKGIPFSEVNAPKKTVQEKPVKPNLVNAPIIDSDLEPELF